MSKRSFYLGMCILLWLILCFQVFIGRETNYVILTAMALMINVIALYTVRKEQ